MKRIVLVLLLLAPAAVFAQAPSGVEWNGTEDGTWDFRMVRQSGNSFSYEATNRTNNRTVRGSATVDVLRQKLKIARTVGGFDTVCDGLFSGDGHFVSGVCYSAQGETFWWATVETAAPGPPPAKLNINTATVRDLEVHLGLEPAQARAIIEAKLKLVAFSNISNLLEGNIVPPDVYATIKDRISIR